jgi:hypothetical protein
MMANPTLAVGWVALITGILGLLALLCLGLLFAGVRVFGPLNDIGIGLTAIASFVLALTLHSQFRAQAPGLSWVALVLAALGALVVVIGSVLVLFRITGYFLSGLYMAAGNALIGLWLVALTASRLAGAPWQHGLTVFGLVAGAFMVLGLATVPGIVKGVDAWDAAPWYVVYVGMAGSLGWLLLYPLWCVLVGWAVMGG